MVYLGALSPVLMRTGSDLSSGTMKMKSHRGEPGTSMLSGQSVWLLLHSRAWRTRFLVKSRQLSRLLMFQLQHGARQKREADEKISPNALRQNNTAFQIPTYAASSVVCLCKKSSLNLRTFIIDGRRRCHRLIYHSVPHLPLFPQVPRVLSSSACHTDSTRFLAATSF